jgi:hypothetical protein
MEQLLKGKFGRSCFNLSEIGSVLVPAVSVGDDCCSIAAEVRVLFVRLLNVSSNKSRNVHDVKA